MRLGKLLSMANMCGMLITLGLGSKAKGRCKQGKLGVGQQQGHCITVISFVPRLLTCYTITLPQGASL